MAYKRSLKSTFSAVIFLILMSVILGYAGPEAMDQRAEILRAAEFDISQTSSPVKVDGSLADPAWEKATVILLPYEWLPGDNIQAPVETECLVTYDDNHFYIAFRCFDPNPSEIRAHLMDRDDMEIFIQDDHISVMLDTFNDERRGFQFRVNPLGVQADANFSESEGYEDFSWDAIWDSAGTLTEWGYAIEIAIPFNQLRFPQSGDVQTWGFGAERSYPRSLRHRMTSHHRERDINCILCQQNKITGMQGISPGLNLELDPTLTSVRTDSRPDYPEGPMESGKFKADPGLSLRWGITPNLILNAAVNPDFSQVEADIAQLDVNTRFALRFPEKRPFFLEGADFFLTPLEAVFTRTVADPEAGGKITGKIGQNAFGFFGTVDRINNLVFPSNQFSSSTSLDQNVTGGVFRYRRDVGQNSTIGMLYTGRVGESYFNHVTGVDSYLRFSQTKSLRFQYLHSETEYPKDLVRSYDQPDGSFGGDSVLASFQHQDRNWRYSADYEDLSTGFRADTGYIPRVDFRRARGSAGRQFWGDQEDWYTFINLGLDSEVVFDHQGEMTDREFNLRALFMGGLQSTAAAVYTRRWERYLGQLYDFHQGLVFSELKPFNGFRLRLTALYGGQVDYQNARTARGLNLMPFAEFSLGRHINVNVQHAFQRLTHRGDEIFLANLTQVRFVYNFTVRMFVRAIVQYLDVSRNPELYSFPVESHTQTLFSQLLLSYKLNPQTVLFLGYSDNSLGQTGIDLARTDRTFFFKLGYAWTR